MTEQPPKHIIRGTAIEGIAFLDPKIKSKTDMSGEIKAQSIAKMHKAFSQNYDGNPNEELEEVWKQVENEGFRRGQLEGQKQGYEVGKEEGFEKGFREGSEKVHNELKHLIQLLNSVALGLALKQEGIFEQLKPEMITFILAVCEQILRKNLSDPKVFLDLIERLLSEAKSILKEGIINIVLAPEDLIMIQENLKDVIYDREEIKKLTFIVDKSIERGNCRVETSLGLINFDIKRVLADLQKKVLEVDLPTS